MQKLEFAHSRARDYSVLIDDSVDSEGQCWLDLRNEYAKYFDCIKLDGKNSVVISFEIYRFYNI